MLTTTYEGKDSWITESVARIATGQGDREIKIITRVKDRRLTTEAFGCAPTEGFCAHEVNKDFYSVLHAHPVGSVSLRSSVVRAHDRVLREQYQSTIALMKNFYAGAVH